MLQFTLSSWLSPDTTNQAYGCLLGREEEQRKVAVFKLVWIREPQVSSDEADVAQLVRATGCGSVGRGFNSHHSPQIKNIWLYVIYFLFGMSGNRAHGLLLQQKHTVGS